jgi:hypothetical protein
MADGHRRLARVWRLAQLFQPSIDPRRERIDRFGDRRSAFGVFRTNSARQTRRRRQTAA